MAKGVLTHRGLGNANRQKAHSRDQSAGQHGMAVREKAAVAAESRSAPSSNLRTIISTTMMRHRRAGQGDDQRTQRNLMKANAQAFMIRKVTP